MSQEKEIKKPGRPKKESLPKEEVISTSQSTESELLKFLQSQSEVISDLKLELQKLQEKKEKDTKKEVQVKETIKNLQDIRETKFVAGFDKIKELDLPKKVSVQRYLNTSNENMGLTEYGISVLDGEGGQGGFKESIGYITKAGVNYYLSGFDEHSKNISSIQDENLKRETLKQVRKVKEILESIMGVDLSSKNADFWRSQWMEVRGPIKVLDLTNPADIILYFAILGGGISLVAPSKVHADESNIAYKHYLHVDSVVAASKITGKRLKNKAISRLENLYEESKSSKMFLIAKNILPIAKGFTKKDSIDVLYNDLYDFIEGVNVEVNKKETPKLFINACKESEETLMKKALVNDAVYYNIFRRNEDRFYYSTDTMAVVGKDMTEILSFLQNPANNSELEELYHRIEKIWNT